MEILAAEVGTGDDREGVLPKEAGDALFVGRRGLVVNGLVQKLAGQVSD